jgi:hypothetical protein
MPVRGQELVAKNIVGYLNGFLKTVNTTMTEVKVLLDDEVTKNISLRDHTLKQLAELDHPYARRHGSRGKVIHEPYWQVHVQSGRLLASKFSGIRDAKVVGGTLSAAAFVGLNENSAKHALYVVFGTSKMIPRPVLQGSRENVKTKAYETIKSRLKFLTFSFRGEETK